MTLRVRAETADDVARVLAIVEAAFESRVEAELVDALRRGASPQVSLVADSEGVVAGHVFFSPIAIEGEGERPAPPACQLAPVAVAPEHQRRGIGNALIRTGLEQCLAIGWKAVFLVGDPAYYARFGFRLAAPSGFHYPGPHDAYLQLLELEDGALAGLGGRIRLHPAFAEVGAE